jgi:hypothetical protein
MLLLAACGGKKDSAPAPAAASGQGSATAAAVVLDATVADAGVDAFDEDEPADAAVVDVPPAKRITSNGIGLLSQKSPAKLAALQKLLPEFEWVDATQELDGEPVKQFDAMRPGKEPREHVLRVVLAGRKLGELWVYVAGYKTEAGIEVDLTGAQLAHAYPDLTCTMTDYRPRRLECYTTSLDNITFSLQPSPDMMMDDVDLTQIAAQKILSIGWSAPGT